MRKNSIGWDNYSAFVTVNGKEPIKGQIVSVSSEMEIPLSKKEP